MVLIEPSLSQKINKEIPVSLKWLRCNALPDVGIYFSAHLHSAPYLYVELYLLCHCPNLAYYTHYEL